MALNASLFLDEGTFLFTTPQLAIAVIIITTNGIGIDIVQETLTHVHFTANSLLLCPLLNRPPITDHICLLSVGGSPATLSPSCD